MGRLRPALNKGGKDHFLPNGRKRPFIPQRIYNKDGTWELRSEWTYPKIEDINNGPMFATIILMAFERALECGGYRAECFTEWFNRYLGAMQVELVQTIEGRLYTVMQKSSGKIMSEKDYFNWQHFVEHLRKYLYGK